MEEKKEKRKKNHFDGLRTLNMVFKSDGPEPASAGTFPAFALAFAVDGTCRSSTGAWVSDPFPIFFLILPPIDRIDMDPSETREGDVSCCFLVVVVVVVVTADE